MRSKRDLSIKFTRWNVKMKGQNWSSKDFSNEIRFKKIESFTSFDSLQYLADYIELYTVNNIFKFNKETRERSEENFFNFECNYAIELCMIY